MYESISSKSTLSIYYELYIIIPHNINYDSMSHSHYQLAKTFSSSFYISTSLLSPSASLSSLIVPSDSPGTSCTRELAVRENVGEGAQNSFTNLFFMNI